MSQVERDDHSSYHTTVEGERACTDNDLQSTPSLSACAHDPTEIRQPALAMPAIGHDHRDSHPTNTTGIIEWFRRPQSLVSVHGAYLG